MEETPTPPLSRMCKGFSSLAWIEPNGKIHWLSMKRTHGTWAFVHYNPDRENSAYVPDSDVASEMLRKAGWIRVSSATDIDVRNIDSISQAAWDAWSTIVTSCAGQIPPDSEMTVSNGRNLSDYFKTTVGDFIEKYCSKRASDAYWGKLMGESRRRKISGRQSRINELYEMHQAIEALSSLAPHIASYLDGLISARNTKDQVLGMLGKFKGYRDSLPQPIFRAMEIVVPGFRTIEDFEGRILQMSEEELDNRLGKLLIAIQSGRLAGTAMSESLVRSIVRSLLRESLEGFTSKTSEISYGKNDPKQLPRELKSIWSQEADHEFFKSLVKVHWIAGAKKSQYFVFRRMNALLNASGKDEISTMGYIGRPSVSEWGEFGIMVQGRTTLAANDMDAIVSGYYRDVGADEIERYSKTSGIPRRASRFSPGKAKGFILDAENFGRQYLGNELIVDNWRPIGLIAPLWFFNAMKNDVPLLGKTRFDADHEKLLRLFVTTELPVYTNNGTPKNMTPFREMLEVR